MIQKILEQIPGFIAGTISGILIAWFAYWLSNKNKPRTVVKTFTHKRNNSELKNIFENNIRRLFSLDQTFLIEPDIPEGANYSRSHSSGQRGYFKYLIEQDIDNFRFRFWDKTRNERWIEVEKHTDKLTIETHLIFCDSKKMFNMLRDNL